jgi:uncharacterized coiled-coil protein SlyX
MNEFEELNGKFAVIVENLNDLSATTAQDRATFSAITGHLMTTSAIANATVNARIDTLESRVASLEAAGRDTSNVATWAATVATLATADTSWIKRFDDCVNEAAEQAARVARLESVLTQLLTALNDDGDEAEIEAAPVATAEQVMDAYKARIRSEGDQ